MKVKRGESSNRVCVYLSNALDNTSTKILGVPEVRSGTGKEESSVVINMLGEWNVSQAGITMFANQKYLE